MNFHHYDNPLVPTRKCPACDQVTRSQPTLGPHNAGYVWFMIDRDQCPACSSFLPRSGLRLAHKNRIARRLLGLAPVVHGSYQTLSSMWRLKEVRR